MIIAALLTPFISVAADKFKMNYTNEELPKIIESYARTSGQKFIMDSSVRGRVTIINPTEISQEDAYGQLSEALAINGFAIVKDGDVFLIKQARSVQRDNIEVTTTLPVERPVRMVNWVINLKYATAHDVMNQLRILVSVNGELSVNERTNQLIITDFTSNLQRAAKLIKQIDISVDASTAKIAGIAKKDREARNVESKKTAARKEMPPETPEKSDK